MSATTRRKHPIYQTYITNLGQPSFVTKIRDRTTRISREPPILLRIIYNPMPQPERLA
jgi:hypothetical protein